MSAIKLYGGYGLAALLGAVIAITTMSAFAQPKQQHYKVVRIPVEMLGNLPQTETFLNEHAAQGWYLHSVAFGGAVFQRK